MSKNVLIESKKINDEIKKQIKIYQKNCEVLNELKKNPLVRKALEIESDNQYILDNLKNLKKAYLLIYENCCHNLLLYVDNEFTNYDTFYTYKCLDCGKNITSVLKMENVIFSGISYEDLKKDYENYLLKYDEETSVQIMLTKYSNELFSDLVNSGVDEIKALKLVKKNR